MSSVKGPFAKLGQSLWSDEESLFESRAEDVAIALAEAVHQAGLTRAELAQRLGWKPSRITRVLTGNTNLTLRTIHEICQAIDLAFDIVLKPSRSVTQSQDQHLEKVLSLQQEASANLNRSKELLEVAEQLSRHAWRQASESARISRYGVPINCGSVGKAV